MSTATADLLVGRNPSTGEALGEVARTPPEALPEIVARARAAQRSWGQTSWPERKAALERFRRELAAEADEWAAAIEAEVGKPREEAMGADVIPSLDAIKWTIQHGGRVLADRRIGAGSQFWLLIPPATLRSRPFGVIGMIGTWNYPLLLNAPPIAQALAAGNAVVWKPSELAPLLGLRLQQCLDRAGLPEGLVTTVFGGPDAAQALIEAGIDKGMFTGGLSGGRAVLGGLARHGVPALAEFSGFDPAIVLAGAPRTMTLRSLLWGAFVGTGQTCVAIKRVYIVGDGPSWAMPLAVMAGELRVGNPAAGPADIGPMISEAARAGFHQKIQATIAAGAKLIHGGAPLDGPGWFYPPTVLRADDTPEPERVLAGAFGPVMLIRGVASVDAAVEAANSSDFGLAASVWGGNIRDARAVARRLEAGMVAVNDAVTPGVHAAAPFGGIKASGFGRTRGELGLREFVQPQTLHVRRQRGMRFHLFPYSGQIEHLLGRYRRFFHPGTAEPDPVLSTVCQRARRFVTIPAD